MKLKQISVFVENKPGSVGYPCKVLADAGINITTLTLADTKDFGILRIISKNWQQAYDVLKAQKFAVSVNEVVALEVENTPGGLSRVLEALERQGLNVEYMYAFAQNDKAHVVIKPNDLKACLAVLEAKGCTVLKKGDL